MIRWLIDRARPVLLPLLDRIRSYREPSYSQDGEDRILAHLFRGPRAGFFVDVGAHHPRQYSNTYLLYLRGWRGINIDPRPGTRARFEKVRPRDLTLECGVDTTPGELTYYLYEEPAYNTFNAVAHETFQRRGFPRSIGVRKVPVQPLAQLLAAHLPAGKPIDLLTVDAEGWDLKVLESNDWTRFRPRVVVAEDGTDVETSLSSPIGRFLSARGYVLLGRTNQSVIWIDKDGERHR